MMSNIIFLVGSPSYQQVAAELSLDDKAPLDKAFREARVTDSFICSSQSAYSRTDHAVQSLKNFALPDESTRRNTASSPEWRSLLTEWDHLKIDFTQRSLRRGAPETPCPNQGLSFPSVVSSVPSSSPSRGLVGAKTALFRTATDSVRYTAKRTKCRYLDEDNARLPRTEVLHFEESSSGEKEEEDFLEQSLALHGEDFLLTPTLDHSPCLNADKLRPTMYSNSINSQSTESDGEMTDSENVDGPLPSLGRPLLSSSEPEMPTPIQAPQCLASLPSAKELVSKAPQTVTTTLVVGIIILQQPRRVIMKRSGRAVELIEAVLGDDTAAGFGVSFWIDPQTPSKNVESRNDVPRKADLLRSELNGLKTGDVVLMQYVALAQFRGRVYGQSIGRGGGRKGRKQEESRWWRTSIRLMYRRGQRAAPHDFNDKDRDLICNSDGLNHMAMHNALRERSQKVKDWVSRFVGPVRASRNEAECVNAAKKRKLGVPGSIVPNMTLPANETPG